jgi:uncharacterized protein YdaU (DUF1376 family)
MNFYKRHIGDYLKDTAHLSLLEHGVYSRLLDVYYTRESGIPDAQAARLIGARGKDETAALKVVLGEFFQLVDGTWIQDRCEREIADAADGEVDRDAKRENERERQRRHRERRKQLFDELRQYDIVPSYDSTTEQLQALLSRVTSGDKDTPESRSVTPPVTRDATANQTPDARSQTPDLKTIGQRTDAVGAPRATVRPAELSAAMRKFSIDAQPGDPRIVAAAEAGISVETIEAACAEAKASDPVGRIKAGFVIAIAQRWTADAAKPRTFPRTTQTRSYHDERADTIAGLTGRSRHESDDERTIDVHATAVARLAG